MKMSPFALANRGIPAHAHVTKTQIRATIRKVRDCYGEVETSGMEAIRVASLQGWL